MATENEKMSEEKVNVSLTQEEFVKEIAHRVMNEDTIQEALHIEPMLTLYTALVMKATWKCLGEYSRMQQVRDMIKGTPKKED